MVAWLVACGPSSSEIKTARDATYDADPHQLFAIAAEVADEWYGLRRVDTERLELETSWHGYTFAGDPGIDGAGAKVKITFIVRAFVPEGEQRAVVHVTPIIQSSLKTRRAGSRDDLPPWVTARADMLSVAIYERVKSFASAH